MSLPPGFLDELRTRVSLAAVVGRKVTWDARKSNPGKGDMWASCPFHQEKSASFHVDDRKGYYYCFGCHAKGDALGFIMETENLGFIEAVEVLAREAGLPMPSRDPQAAKVADRRAELCRVVEDAVQYYRLQLQTSAGAAARAYLAGRGLRDAALARWDIGYAPDTRHGLFQALVQKGYAADLIVDAGVCAMPDADKGRHSADTPYDRFRGRIIFPIRDARGRAISLGGRAMAVDARAKYLNGPETALFDKGRNLYNHAPAREAVGKGQPLIVAEGYMDVIALVEAGFGAAVAPLGTAITPEQLALMWRIHDEPIIALDGDTAGVRAALRVIDLALPLLVAGKGLRFAVLPSGQDPDDLLRAQGAGAMQKLLDQARPMVALLWQRETEGRVFDSPERRAALDKSLRAALARIADPSIRSHYGEEIKRLQFDLFRARPRPAFVAGGGRGKWQDAPQPPLAATRGSLLANAKAQVDETLREAVILARLIRQPELIRRFEPALERLDLAGRGHAGLRALLLAHADAEAGALRDILAREAPEALEAVFSQPHVRNALRVSRSVDTERAALELSEELAKLGSGQAARREIEDAVEDFKGLVDEGLTWRISQATTARDQANRIGNEDTTDLGEDRAGLLDRLNRVSEGISDKKTR